LSNLLIALGAMFLQQTFASVGKVLPAVMAPLVIAELDADPALVGAYYGVAAAASLFAQMGCGSFIVRYGALRMRQVALVLLGGGMASAADGPLPGFGASAIIDGGGAAVSTPTSSQLLGRVSPPRLAPLVFSSSTAVPAGLQISGFWPGNGERFLGWRGATLVTRRLAWRLRRCCSPCARDNPGWRMVGRGLLITLKALARTCGVCANKSDNNVKLTNVHVARQDCAQILELHGSRFFEVQLPAGFVQPNFGVQVNAVGGTENAAGAGHVLGAKCRLEYVLRHAGQLLPSCGLIVGDAEIGKGFGPLEAVKRSSVLIARRALCLLHLPQQFASAALSSNADFDVLPFRFDVAGLTGVKRKSGCFVANFLDLVDRSGLGNGRAHRVVEDELCRTRGLCHQIDSPSRLKPHLGGRERRGVTAAQWFWRIEARTFAGR